MISKFNSKLEYQIKIGKLSITRFAEFLDLDSIIQMVSWGNVKSLIGVISEICLSIFSSLIQCCIASLEFCFQLSLSVFS